MSNDQVKWAAAHDLPSETVETAAPLERLVGQGTEETRQETSLNFSLQEFEQFRSAIINNRSMPTTVFVHGEVILGGSMTPQDSYELVNTYCSKDYAELEVKSMKMAYSDGRLICKGDNFSLGRPV